MGANAGARVAIGHEHVLAILLISTLAVLASISDKFLTVDNILNQGRLMTEVALVALPMTFVIVTGGIDLSVGSIMGLAAIVLGYAWKNLGVPLELAVGRLPMQLPDLGEAEPRQIFDARVELDERTGQSLREHGAHGGLARASQAEQRHESTRRRQQRRRRERERGRDLGHAAERGVALPRLDLRQKTLG